MTAFNGYGTKITTKAMELMAGHAGLAGAQTVVRMADSLYEIVQHFHKEARNIGVPAALAHHIQQQITQKWQQLRQ